MNIRRSVFAVGLLCLVGCSNDSSVSNTIVLVVPDAYIGPVVIVPDTSNDDVVKSSSEFLFTVDDSGVARVSQSHFDLFHETHDLHARSTTGVARDAELSNGQGNARYQMYYFGPASDADTFLHRDFSAQTKWFEERGLQWSD